MNWPGYQQSLWVKGTKMWIPYCNITKNMTATEFTEVNKGKIYNFLEKMGTEYKETTHKGHDKDV